MTETRPLGPSRKGWFWFITQSHDRLRSRHYRDLRERYAPEDQERGTLASELESLGELGSKTEPVGSDAREGGIFGFRSAAKSQTKLPLMEWIPFATHMMKDLIALEGAP